MPKRPAQSELPLCLMNQTCDLTLQGQYDRCGLPAGALSPLPFAEDLCLRAMKLQYRRNGEPKTSVKRVVDAWELVELSLAEEDQTASDGLIAHAREQVETVLDDPEISPIFDTYARILDASFPLFESRQKDYDPTKVALRAAQMKYARLIRRLQDPALRISDSERTASMLLGVFGCIGLRELDPDQVIYPASFRESRNRAAVFATYNHQYYGVVDGDKVPIAIHTRRRAGEHDERMLLKINYVTFIRDAARVAFEFGYPRRFDTAVECTPVLLAQEALGGRVGVSDKFFLQALSTVFNDRISSFVADRHA